MTLLSPFTFFNFYPTIKTKTFDRSYNKSLNCFTLLHSTTNSTQNEERTELSAKEEPKIRWKNVSSEISLDEKKAISQLPLSMSNRSKALMKRIICFSTGDESVSLLLASWVRSMNPKRADWLSVLKEIKRIQSPLYIEVMEYAILEDSFEANERDYTKLIHIYGKQNLLQKAEKTLHSMKQKGFTLDQVTLTVLINMYSKSGDLTRAKESFEEIKLLGLKLDKRAYGSMIMSYIRAEMLDLAENLMKESEANEIYTGSEVYKALLRAYSNKGDCKGAQRVFDSIQFAGIVPDSRVCAALLKAYCSAGENEQARCVIENMRSAGIKPCDRCINLMLCVYERENRLDKALDFLLEMESDGIVISQEVTMVLAKWFERLGIVEQMEKILREVSRYKNVT